LFHVKSVYELTHLQW